MFRRARAPVLLGTRPRPNAETPAPLGAGVFTWWLPDKGSNLESHGSEPYVLPVTPSGIRWGDARRPGSADQVSRSSTAAPSSHRPFASAGTYRCRSSAAAAAERRNHRLAA